MVGNEFELSAHGECDLTMGPRLRYISYYNWLKCSFENGRFKTWFLLFADNC